jgi:predicted metal-dependent HD superfamily phosphohydrolase
MNPLASRFSALVRRLGGREDGSAAAEALLAAWNDAARCYHGAAHLVDCLAQLDGVPDPVPERDLVEAALWYHDAVYDSRAPDNEARSAAWAGEALRAIGVPPAATAEVARLVTLTTHAVAPADQAGRLVCDVDLSILGRPPDEYDDYARRIRAEYAWVPEPAYRAGRREVLGRLLGRDPLYGTDCFRARYEAPARRNLERELRRLASAEPV